MARLRDAKPKNTSGSYARLFDNDELGELASKVQSAVISSGSELESMISNAVEKINDLDTFLKQDRMPEGVLLARKRDIKKSKILDFDGSEPDFMVFVKKPDTHQTCHIIELKDGHVFDTKKAMAEKQSMRKFIERNGQRITYKFESHFCAFNQDSKEAIWNGFKKKIELSEVMTGREFCNLLEINYDEIVKSRRADGADNIHFFLSELIKIDSISEHLRNLLSQDVGPDGDCHIPEGGMAVS